jgi:hypothetical protein
MDVSFHPAVRRLLLARRRARASVHQIEVSRPFGVELSRDTSPANQQLGLVWTELSVGTTLVPLAGCRCWSAITPIVQTGSDGVHRVGRCRALECPPAAEHFVDDRAEREDASGRRADVPSSSSAPMIRAVCSRRILGTRPTPRVPPIGYSG